jgi:pyrroline-5-carboxylate reductase
MVSIMAAAGEKRIGIIGLGRMGRCLAKGLIESGSVTAKQISFTARTGATAERVAAEFPITAAKSNRQLVDTCSTVILAVKPQNAAGVLEEIGPHLTPAHTLISIVASVSLSQMGEFLKKGVPVARAMPNTPAFVREGITAACLNAAGGDRDWERVKGVFSPVGRLVRVDESQMDAVTGLSGCGPAYVYVILESLTEAGIKVGLPRELASELASQTVLGAARMLQITGRHPAALKDEVTTPAGCTIDGLLELEEGKIRVTLIKAVVQATKRAKSLAKRAGLKSGKRAV